jgi:hypothetical protein
VKQSKLDNFLRGWVIFNDVGPILHSPCPL